MVTNWAAAFVAMEDALARADALLGQGYLVDLFFDGNWIVVWALRGYLANEYTIGEG